MANIKEKNQISKENREKLKKFSLLAKEREEVNPTGKMKVNELLAHHVYNFQRNNKLFFKSFLDWQFSGYKVRKGEKAFLFWSKPNPRKNKDVVEETTDDSEDKQFYIAYLFSNEQVEKI